MFRGHGRLYVAFAISALLLMTFQHRTSALKPFGFLGSANASLSKSFSTATEGSRDILRAAIKEEAEMERLRIQLRQLQMMELRYKQMELENERLRKLLGISDGAFRKVAAARVIGRKHGLWSNAVVIDQGEAHGVRPEMAVITDQGLAGRVIETEPETATVLLIDDSRFSASVRLSNTRIETIYTGAGRGQGVLKYILYDVEIPQSETVVTSGLDALFPQGIRTAFIANVTTEAGELFHEVRVVPFVDTRKIEEVLVVAR